MSRKAVEIQARFAVNFYEVSLGKVIFLFLVSCQVKMKMTKPLANEKKVERKWRTNSKMDDRGHCQRVRSGHAQDYKMQILVHLNSQNVEGWMAKQLSAGCVNIVVACMLSTDYI